MSKLKILLINPTQLFEQISALDEFDKIIIYEEPKFFTKYQYHKQKLILHRSSCRYYFDWLISKKYNVEYFEYNKHITLKPTHVYEPYDHELSIKYKACIKIPSPNFLITPELIFRSKSVFFDGNHFSHEKFYKWQRKRLKVLMSGNTPQGNKWSFDEQNRDSIPKNESIPKIPSFKRSNYIKEAVQYINKNFKQNPGEIKFIWPITHIEAKAWLHNFIKHKFQKFGRFEDASLENEPILFHSALSASLNIGLITDQEVLNAILKIRAPLQSKEGFVRQLIGWRNYMLSIYLLCGKQLSKMNFWRHNKKLSYKWWTGNVGITPIDDIIKNKILKYAFTHHIERLMYLGVYMFLCETSPKDVYRWFMEMTIDAYEWVMVPNIYGMSQNADNNVVMRRLYICSSNYIRKMSNYKKGEWTQIWDARYYAFIAKHLKYFEKNYFYAAQAANWKNKSPEEKKKIKHIAKLQHD